MRKLPLAAAALALCASVVVPAGVASAEPARRAIETIAGLEADGYTVRIDRVGSAPLSECTVVDVRNPRTITRTIRVGADSDLVVIVDSRTVQVSLDCRT